MPTTKRGRVTETGTKVRQRRPRAYQRELSAKAAYNCEFAEVHVILESRCRCRCRGRLHGAQRALDKISPDDPHAPAVAYCVGDCNCRWHHSVADPPRFASGKSASATIQRCGSMPDNNLPSTRKRPTAAAAVTQNFL